MYPNLEFNVVYVGMPAMGNCRDVMSNSAFAYRGSIKMLSKHHKDALSEVRMDSVISTQRNWNIFAMRTPAPGQGYGNSMWVYKYDHVKKKLDSNPKFFRAIGLVPRGAGHVTYYSGRYLL